MQKVIIAIAVSFAAGAALVYWKFPRTIQLPPEVKTETVTRTVTRTVEKIVQPDGTVIVREITKEDDKTKTNTKTLPVPQPGWSLGLAYRPDVSRLLEHQKDAWEITAGRRLMGDVWMTGVVNPLRREVSLGVAYQF